MLFNSDRRRRPGSPNTRVLAVAATLSLLTGNLPALATSTGSSTHGKALAFQLPMNGPITAADSVGAPVPGNGNELIVEEVRGWNDDPAPSTSTPVTAVTHAAPSASVKPTVSATSAATAPSSAPAPAAPKLATAPPSAMPAASETSKAPSEHAVDPNALPFNMQEVPPTEDVPTVESSQDQAPAEKPSTEQPKSEETDAKVEAPKVESLKVESAKVESAKVESAADAIKDIEVAAETKTIEEGGVIVIDNDGEVPQKAEYVWKEIQDADGKTKIESGATFPITMMSALSSKTAKVGQPIEARLNVDINIGGKLIAKKGDMVRGHITSAEPARRIIHAELSKKRWMRANGAVGFQFDEILNYNGEHLPLVARPAQHARIVKNKAEGRVLGVNHNGEIASPLSTQLKHQAAHLAIRGAASAGGVFSFGIVPLAYGVVGAMNPSFAFLHPVGTNVPHRRLKGFAMGVVSGLPGGFLIADTIIRGQEAVVKPGDQFEAEFKQEFTGEAATEATLIPGATSKVRGEVLTDVNKSKKK